MSSKKSVKKCSSCGTEVLKNYSEFKCPKCGEKEIIRCDPCRKLGIAYKCDKCGLEGP
ncbi:MAG: zinc finger domain-containing protein [Candidatus Altiarchaeota archaeon]